METQGCKKHRCSDVWNRLSLSKRTFCRASTALMTLGTKRKHLIKQSLSPGEKNQEMKVTTLGQTEQSPKLSGGSPNKMFLNAWCILPPTECSFRSILRCSEWTWTSDSDLENGRREHPLSWSGPQMRGQSQLKEWSTIRRTMNQSVSVWYQKKMVALQG